MTTLFIIFLFLIPFLLLIVRKWSKNPPTSSKLPPGSLGLPIIGQSLTLLRTLRANKAEKWLQQRIQKYGSISKLSLFGKPTVFIHGQAANKFVFSSDGSTVGNSQPESVKMLLGETNLLELSGKDHKRLRDALGGFLRPECLKQYVSKMDEEVRLHIKMHWQGKEEVKVLPLMKTLTFNIICSLLFGVEGPRRKNLVDLFEDMIKGMWSLPINLPFTRFNHGLQSSAKARNLLKKVIAEKREQLEEKDVNPQQDLITSLLSHDQGVTEEEIVDNARLVMVAGHDTSSVVITFLVRLLANDTNVYAAVLQEQEDIAKSKTKGEFLTWEDLAKMRYTWRVAQETMRMDPPIFGGFRKAVKDIEYEGYLIPKGWQIFWVTSMTQMDDALFPEPSKFNPSRFENPSLLPPYSFIPFGGGLRICPGYEFARIEILVTIHYLITCFTWKMSADNNFSRDPMPIPTKGLPVQIIQKKEI